MDKVNDLEAENTRIKDRQDEIERRWGEVKQVSCLTKKHMLIKVVPGDCHRYFWSQI